MRLPNDKISQQNSRRFTHNFLVSPQRQEIISKKSADEDDDTGLTQDHPLKQAQQAGLTRRFGEREELNARSSATADDAFKNARIDGYAMYYESTRCHGSVIWLGAESTSRIEARFSMMRDAAARTTIRRATQRRLQMARSCLILGSSRHSPTFFRSHGASPYCYHYRGDAARVVCIFFAEGNCAMSAPWRRAAADCDSARASEYLPVQRC